jgi:HEAT repeat protein
MSKHDAAKRPTEVAAQEQIEIWIRELASDNGLTREAARNALVRAGKPAVSPLIERLEDSRVHVRWEVAKALADIADPEAAPALVRALEDEESAIRWLAAEGLIAMENAAIPPLLQALTERSSSLWLRNGAHHTVLARKRPSSR